MSLAFGWKTTSVEASEQPAVTQTFHVDKENEKREEEEEEVNRFEQNKTRSFISR